jgi:hypothetical protein
MNIPAPKIGALQIGPKTQNCIFSKMAQTVLMNFGSLWIL